MAVGAASGGITAAFQGANILQGALIGGFSSAVSFGMGQSPWAQKLAGKGSFGQGFVSVMSGGVVGGLSSVATGSSFWQGFTQGGISAGLSFAANQVAGAIVEADDQTSSNTAEDDNPGVDLERAKTENGKWQKEDDVLNKPNIKKGILEDIGKSDTSKKEFGAIIYKDKDGNLQYKSLEGTYDHAPSMQDLLDAASIDKSSVVAYLHYHAQTPGHIIPGTLGPDGKPYTATRFPSASDARIYRKWHLQLDKSVRLYQISRGGEIFRYVSSWGGSSDKVSFQSIQKLYDYKK